MISFLAATSAVFTAGTAQVSIAVISREEIRDGKTYEVSLAPPCKDKRPICKPWERAWNENLQMEVGDVVTPDGFVLREKKDA